MVASHYTLEEEGFLLCHSLSLWCYYKDQLYQQIQPPLSDKYLKLSTSKGNDLNFPKHTCMHVFMFISFLKYLCNIDI